MGRTLRSSMAVMVRVGRSMERRVASVGSVSGLHSVLYIAKDFLVLTTWLQSASSPHLNYSVCLPDESNNGPSAKRVPVSHHDATSFSELDPQVAATIHIDKTNWFVAPGLSLPMLHSPRTTLIDVQLECVS